MKKTTESQALEQYLSVVSEYGGVPSKWQFYFEYIFDGVELRDKTMLDVGGGMGRFSYYAACAGATKVICLEPSLSGSRSETTETARQLRSRLQSPNNVIFKPCTFQEFDASNEQFDILLLHNSINHLDEGACTVLHEDNQAREIYLQMFRKLSALAKKDAKLIAADCSRYNFFSAIKAQNPFAPTIEWQKHQPPALWADLLSRCGFGSPRIRWAAPSKLRSIGQLLLGNKVCAYFYSSHFCVTMEKMS